MRADVQPASHGVARQSPFAWLVYLCFATGVLLSICAVKVGIGGFPLRALFLFGAAGILALSDPHGLIDDIKRGWRVLLLIAAFAALGLLVSTAVGTGIGRTLRQIIEIHLQASLMMILGLALVRSVGVRPVMMAFLVPILLSGMVAIAQALGVDIAWQARAAIGKVMGDPQLTREFYERRYRALGLSYSPVHLGTQACLMLAIFFGWRLYRNPQLMHRFDVPLLVMLAVSAAICIASGNRSPLLGFAVFFLIYVLIAEPKRFILVLPLLIIGMIVGFELMSVLADEGARFARTDDSSAAGRATLAKYGLWLILDRPLGYGLNFDSTKLWENYTHYVIYDENPMAIRRWPPHNYLIMILAKYGLLAIPLALLALPRRRIGWIGWAAFIPYAVHIYFHNEGPLQSDNLIWGVIPVLLIAIDRLGADRGPRLEGRRWTRTYRARQRMGEAEPA